MAVLFENCKGCKDRYPGCQDHCEKYKADRAEYDRRKAAMAQDNVAKMYIYENVGKTLDSKAKRKRDNRGHKWFRR